MKIRRYLKWACMETSTHFFHMFVQFVQFDFNESMRRLIFHVILLYSFFHFDLSLHKTTAFTHTHTRDFKRYANLCVPLGEWNRRGTFCHRIANTTRIKKSVKYDRNEMCGLKTLANVIKFQNAIEIRCVRRNENWNE